jgi:NDP-sugar pyrophosphorylase family protein
MFPIVILAGGLATRMRPATEKQPKSLLAVSGVPFILWQLDLLRRKGITDVILCLGYLGEQIEAYLGRCDDFQNLNIRYSYDGETPLGTGGALKKAIKDLDTPFFVLYGDSYLDIEYMAVQETFLNTDSSALMTVYRNNGLFDKSNVQYADGKIIRYDKRNPTKAMRYIDYGLGILNRDLLAVSGFSGTFDLSDVYTQLSERGALSGYEVYKRFYEIGSFEGMADLEKYLKGGGND